MVAGPGKRIDGTAVYRLRTERGWSQNRLVQEVQAAAKELGVFETGLTAQRISKWENGHSGISAAHGRLLEYAFARTMESNGHDFIDDMNRRAFLLGTTATVTLAVANSLGAEPWQRLAGTLNNRADINTAAIEGLEALNVSLSGMFQPVAPRHLTGPVRAHIETLTQLLDTSAMSPSVRNQLTSLAAEMTILLGWLSKEEGDDVTAQQCFTAALSATVEAGDNDLGAYAVASAATLPAFRSSPKQSLGLLTSDEVRGAQLHRARPSTRVWIAVLQAEVHTRTGSEAEAFEALDQAERLLSEVDPDDGRPPVLGHFDATSLVGERGITAVRLDRPHEAGPAIDEALVGMTDYPKTQSRLLTNAAKAHLRQGRVEEAATMALRSLNVARQTGSGVGVVDVRELRPDFDRYSRTDAVRQLDEALAVPL
jgi:transcriptional regulator with XRE-family HTH domain